MSKNFERKASLRTCMADGGLAGLRQRTIDDAVDKATAPPKPAAAPAPAPAPSDADKDAAVGIHIPAPVKTAPPKKTGLFGLGVLGLRDGGAVNISRDRDAELSPTLAAVKDRVLPAMAAAGDFMVGGAASKLGRAVADRYPDAADRVFGAADKLDDAVLRRVPKLADGGSTDDDLMLAMGGAVQGPGGPTDDKVPAMLSKGEYVLPADTVKQVGVRNLEALRHATHTPVRKMADGGYPDLDPQDQNALRAPLGFEQNSSPFALVDASTGNPAPAPGVSVPQQMQPLAAPKTVAQMDAAPQDTAGLPPGITRTGNTFSGVGNGNPDAERQAALQRFANESNDMAATIRGKIAAGDLEGANQLAFNGQTRALVDQAYGQRQAAQAQYAAGLQQQAREADFQKSLRSMPRAMRQSVLQSRGQDIAAQTAARGQDVQTRGQDITAQIAGGEQGVQRRGQDLTFSSNAALRNLQAAQFGRQMYQQDREFGLQSDANQRAGQKQTLDTVNDLVNSLHTINGPDGKPQIDAAAAATTRDKVMHGLENAAKAGVDINHVPPSMLSDFVHDAKESTDIDAATKGFVNKALAAVTGTQRGTSRDVNDYRLRGVEPGALVDRVQTNVGPISANAYTRRDYSSVFPSLNPNNTPDVERTEEVGKALRKLRSSSQ